MIGVSVFQAILFAGCVGSSPAHVEFAKEVRAALAELESLSFVVDIAEDCPKLSFHPAIKRTLEVRVLMKDGGAFRVEAFEDGKASAIVVSDGKTVTEWNAEENAWTHYSITPIGEGFQLRKKLVTDLPLTRYADSWVDLDGAVGAYLGSLITADETSLARSQNVDGRVLDVLTYKKTEWNLLQRITETITLWFDPTTHLIVKESLDIDGWSLFRSLHATTHRSYRDFRLNVKVPPGTFAFVPPEGSTFISPNAGRFRRSVPVGEPAPNFALPTLDGRMLSLMEFRGRKPVLLVFWATWCVPCIQEIPALCNLHDDLGDGALAIIGVATDTRVEPVESFVKRRSIPYTIVHDAKDVSGKLYYVKSLPHSVLIDKAGVVVQTWQGWGGPAQEREIRRALARLGVGD